MSFNNSITVTINWSCPECAFSSSWVSIDGSLPGVLHDCAHRKISCSNRGVIVSEVKPRLTWRGKLYTYMRMACISDHDAAYVVRFVDEHAHEWNNLAS